MASNLSGTENYYDALLDEDFNRLSSSPGQTGEGDSWRSAARLFLAFLSRVGFVLIQVGSVPVNNVNVILLQNLVDICCVTMVYFVVGSVVAYNGEVLAGVIGEGHWSGGGPAAIDKDEAMIAWHAAVIASGISTSGIVGRTHVIAYLTNGILLAGLTQPLLVHWIWTTDGWMTENSLAGSPVRFKDFAGSSVVHVLGGLSGLIGCMVLGRRILRLKDLDEASVAPASSGTNFAGTIFVFLGLQGLNLPTSETAKLTVTSNQLSSIFINGLLAASSCSLFIVALHFVLTREAFNHWTVMRCVQGIISGLVIVSAAIDVYSPLVSIALGCTAAIIFYLTSKLVLRSALEDYCNIVASHFACGLFGSLLTPFSSYTTDSGTASVFMNFVWHLICLMVIFALTLATLLPTFLVLERLGFLRNKSECLNHLRAVTALENGSPRSYMQRLFSPIDHPDMLLQSGLLTGDSKKHEPSRFSRYRNETDEMQEAAAAATISTNVEPAGPSTNLSIRNHFSQKPDKRKRKMRQLYTLPSNTLDHPEEPEDTIFTREWPRVARLSFSETTLSSIKKRHRENKLSSQSEIIRSSETREFTTFRNLPAEIGYPVQKTQKRVNLRDIFTEQDIKINVLIEPRFHCLSSCDSLNENCIYDTFMKSKIIENNETSNA